MWCTEDGRIKDVEIQVDMHGGAPGAPQLVSDGRGLGQRAHAEWLDAGRRELVLLGRIDRPRTCQDQRRGKSRHGRGEPLGSDAGQGAKHHAVERS